MKRTIAILILAALLLSACGKEPAPAPTEPVNLETVYVFASGLLPEMMTLEGETRLNFLGIDEALCDQVITAVCANGLMADEIWLVRAKDQAALDEIKTLAESRLEAKKQETESYLPEQYAIVKEAKLLTHDLYLALIVSPDAAEMQSAFESAVK